MSLLEIFNQKGLSARPKIRAGDIVRVYQKDPTKEGSKPQIFEGVVIARKHGFGKTATMTVRRSTGDVAIEKIYPLHSPVIEKIEIVQRSKVRQAKLYYLRDAQGKRARLKRKNVDVNNISETKATVIKEISEDESVDLPEEGRGSSPEIESPNEDTDKKEEAPVEEKS